MGRKVTPDRGYAWVVLAASVGCNYVSGVLVYFVGVIHAELLHKFQSDVTTTAWAGSLYSSLQMLSAPLASWLVQRYSCRVSVVLGGILLCVGFVTSAFVTSVLHLVFTYGLIAGLGLGLTYSPSLMVITFYFEKFRGLASGISVSGCAVGILSGSLLTQTFIDMYSLNGAFFLIAGFGLQSAVFGMLYRPTHHDGTRNQRSREKKTLNYKEEVSWQAGEKSQSQEKMIQNSKNPYNQEMVVSLEGQSPECVDDKNCPQNMEDSEKKMPDSTQTSPLLVTELNEQIHNGKKPPHASTEANVEESLAHSNLLTDTQNEVQISLEKKPPSGGEPSSEMETAQRTSFVQQMWNQLNSLRSLLKNWAFLLHCASIFFAGFNMSGVYLHLPEYVRTLGTRPTQAAALFVGVGVFSLISRIGSGLLLTSPRVNGLILSVLLMGTCGSVSCLFPWFSSTYVGQMVFACLFGLSTGGFFTLINVLTVQLVGFEFLTTAYGVLIFVMGVGYVAGPPLSGLIVDYGGTYEHSFLFLGMAMFASAAFDLLAKFVDTKKKREL